MLVSETVTYAHPALTVLSVTLDTSYKTVSVSLDATQENSLQAFNALTALKDALSVLLLLVASSVLLVDSPTTESARSTVPLDPSLTWLNRHVLPVMLLALPAFNTLASVFHAQPATILSSLVTPTAQLEHITTMVSANTAHSNVLHASALKTPVLPALPESSFSSPSATILAPLPSSTVDAPTSVPADSSPHLPTAALNATTNARPATTDPISVHLASLDWP